MCWSYKWTSLRHTGAIYHEVKAIKQNFNWEPQTQIISDVAQQNVESTPLLEVVILVNVLKLQVNIIATHRLRRRLAWSQAIWLSKVQNQSSVRSSFFGGYTGALPKAPKWPETTPLRCLLQSGHVNLCCQPWRSPHGCAAAVTTMKLHVSR